MLITEGLAGSVCKRAFYGSGAGTLAIKALVVGAVIRNRSFH
jgi:hypothetical protein